MGLFQIAEWKFLFVIVNFIIDTENDFDSKDFDNLTNYWFSRVYQLRLWKLLINSNQLNLITRLCVNVHQNELSEYMALNLGV